MVKQQEQWTNLSISICNLLIISMSDLDKTLDEDIPLGIKINSGTIVASLLVYVDISRPTQFSRECF